MNTNGITKSLSLPPCENGFSLRLATLSPENTSQHAVGPLRTPSAVLHNPLTVVTTSAPFLYRLTNAVYPSKKN
jgi:hypothetical protein